MDTQACEKELMQLGIILKTVLMLLNSAKATKAFSAVNRVGLNK